jgi:hypothetical protein
LAAILFLIGMAIFFVPAIRGTPPDSFTVIVYGLSIVPSAALLLFDIDRAATEWGLRATKLTPGQRRRLGRWIGAFLMLIAILAVAVGVALAVGTMHA